jgi:serine/threonine-protein kinase RsbT
MVDLIPVIRGVVRSRVRDPHAAEDLVQETLARVMSARHRVEPGSLRPYAAVTARNLVATWAERKDRARDRAHLLTDRDDQEPPIEDLLRQERRSLMTAALNRLPETDRVLLLTHEVDGQDTRTMAVQRSSTAGAVAARLHRARARLRVEFLLLSENVEPPTERCRAVLRALSSADRRRQGELDAANHVVRCDCCSRIGQLLQDRRGGASDEEVVVRVPVTRDADVVQARGKGREAALRVGFSSTDATLIATAISEITRNIVKFADHGEVVISPVTDGARRGVLVEARDSGAGIDDVDKALMDGYSTYHGLGLGLPGARRLMDKLTVDSVPGEGTTVTMEKWL